MAADGSAEYGRLEVFHSGGWGTVCDNSGINPVFRRPAFSPRSADVACRQLGYERGFKIQKLEDDQADRTARIAVVQPGLHCRGNERTISACPRFGLAEVRVSCQHDADTHLVCHNGPNPGAHLP
eukprot:jgi/Ulvmu1/8828/UM049_0008.1